MKLFPAFTFSFVVVAVQMASAQLASKNPEESTPQRVAHRAQGSSQAAVAQAPRPAQYANAPRNFSPAVVRQSPSFTGRQFQGTPASSLNQTPNAFRNFAAVNRRRPAESIPYRRGFDPAVAATNSDDSQINPTGRRADFQNRNRQFPNRNGRDRAAWQNQNSVWQGRNREGSTWQGANGGDGSFRDAFARHHREHHHRDWWRSHYSRIVIATGGCYYWNAGYWYPAWGYDPSYSDYAYDGPIYSYDGLPPDQVIVKVQSVLQEEGYYTEAVDGVLGPSTRQAIAEWQRDHGLALTTAIDEPTLRSLGLL